MEPSGRAAGDSRPRRRRAGSFPTAPRRLWRARETDLEELLAVEREVFRARAFGRAQIRCLLRCQRTVAVLARVGVEPAGWVAISWRQGASTCRIVDLAVRARFRRAGLGQDLIRWALAFGCGEGFAGVTLEVEEENRAARALYAGLGFVTERRLPHYYRIGGHGLRMVLWFHPVGGHRLKKKRAAREGRPIDR
jgi:ribosomal protein S18 acetylase RimI-like enzyme